MKFNINIDKENLKVYGHTAGRIGKAIFIEGTKALVLKTAAAAITTSFEDGFGSVKQLKLDDVIGEDKKSKSATPKKKWFTKKEKDAVEEVIEGMETVEDKLEKAKKILEDK